MLVWHIFREKHTGPTTNDFRGVNYPQLKLKPWRRVARKGEHPWKSRRILNLLRKPAVTLSYISGSAWKSAKIQLLALDKSHESLSNMALMWGSYREPEGANSNIPLQSCLWRQSHSLTDNQVHSKGKRRMGKVGWRRHLSSGGWPWLPSTWESLPSSLKYTHTASIGSCGSTNCLQGWAWGIWPQQAGSCITLLLIQLFWEWGDGRRMETWLNGSRKLGMKQ